MLYLSVAIVKMQVGLEGVLGHVGEHGPAARLEQNFLLGDGGRRQGRFDPCPSDYGSQQDVGNLAIGPRSDGGGGFVCPKCGTSYAQNCSLWRHRQRCEGLLDFSCKFCDRKFYRKDKYREHLLNRHQYVDKTLGAPGKARLPFPNQTGPGKVDKIHACPRCRQVFSQSGSLWRHRRHCEGMPYEFCCKFCQQKFHRRDKLRTHQKTDSLVIKVEVPSPASEDEGNRSYQDEAFGSFTMVNVTSGNALLMPASSSAAETLSQVSFSIGHQQSLAPHPGSAIVKVEMDSPVDTIDEFCVIEKTHLQLFDTPLLPNQNVTSDRTRLMSLLPEHSTAVALGAEHDEASATESSSYKPYSCPKCGKVYAHRGSLWRHQCKCEGRIICCIFCEKIFYRKDGYREHLLAKHNFVDEVLGAPRFAALLHQHTSRSFVGHIASGSSQAIPASFNYLTEGMHPDIPTYKELSRAQQESDKQFICQKCGRVYAHQGSLWRHQCKCEGRYMKCSFCDQLFYRKDLLRQHLLNKHQYVDEVLGTIFSREEPGRKAFTPSQWEPNAGLSAESSQLIASSPNVTFDLCHNLNVQQPSSETTWATQLPVFFPAETYVRPGLDSRQRATKSSKRYPCQKCGATFAQSGTLGRHRRKCEGRFELSCLFCDMKFYRKDMHREHMLSKHQAVRSRRVAHGSGTTLLSSETFVKTEVDQPYSHDATGLLTGGLRLPDLSDESIHMHLGAERTLLQSHSHSRDAAPIQGFYLQPSSLSAYGEGADLSATAYQCPKCQVVITHPRSVNRHRMLCDGVYKLACRICGKKFHRKDKYKKHMKQHSQ
ncbi:hypothetical protein BaRGS_00027499 [Batillaria attramentaria]|uniref:C2H2-type domain-containing protein n=1 Tax=Batillaria attramentaria TaxID=370345 RepID=A0ABD0K229_9CAEN